MSGLQIFLTYAISWWMVLFMVLPHRARPPQVPEIGHASGAPVTPRIGRKLALTSGFAIIPTVIFYLLIGYLMPAYAADELYHVGGKSADAGDCVDGVYQPPADLNAVDGVGAGGKRVRSATIGGAQTDAIAVDLNINGDNYVRQPVGPAGRGRSPNSYLGLGRVSANPDGTATLNGKPLTVRSTDCLPKGKSQ